MSRSARGVRCVASLLLAGLGLPFLSLPAASAAGAVALSWRGEVAAGLEAARRLEGPRATEHLERAAALARTEGATPAELAGVLDELGQLYIEGGRYPAAEQALEEALEIRRRALGDGDPSIAETLGRLSHLRWNQERYADALTLLQEALRLRQDALGPTAPLVARSLADLAMGYASLAEFQQQEGSGRPQGFRQAESHFRQALTIAEQQRPADPALQSDILLGLADVMRRTGRAAEAEELKNRATPLVREIARRDRALAPPGR